MRFPIAVEPGTETSAYGVVVPDLPGCFSAGDTLDEALANAECAITTWIETTLDNNGTVPAPSTLEALHLDPPYAGCVLAVVSIDPALLDDTPEHVELTLPRRILQRLDEKAHAAGISRSGLIAELALATVAVPT